jgi:signal transduction histidine kinase/ActR/RegA family two-component response regulator
LEGSQISVWEFDLRTYEVWLDAAWRPFLNHPAAETFTNAFALLRLVHPQDRRRVVAAAIKTMKDKTASYAIDHRVRTANGEWLWVHSRGRVIERDLDGRPQRMSGTNTNINRHKQHEASHALLKTQLLESQRLEAIASLEAQLRESQKMEAVGTLAGGIAHDFNNILATILGNTELARLDASASPLALESLEEIHKAATRARDLVQQILSFSRRQPTERKRLGLAPLLEESARLLRSTLPARMTVEVHCDAALPAVMADATQIQQVLINLATNAMQAMGGSPGRVRFHLDTVMLDAEMAAAHPVLHSIHTKRPGLTLRLAVSDNGPGMDAATLSRVFEPFFTTKPVDEGTGLGLSVVHGIVQAHDGAIAVDSQPGKGATFTLYLPVAEAETAVPEPKPSTTLGSPVQSLNQSYRILYLDDDESLVFLVKRLLERRGCRISAHTNQRAALDTLRADPDSFDLVVTDYNMPGMSGLDVAREVRRIRADLPVAVASGFIDEVLSANAEGAGVRELIFKANTAEDFCATVLRLAESGAVMSQAF